MNISIVIPCYNSQDTIPSTLESIAKQKADFPYEVIVVDCSESKAVENICQGFSFVKYHHEEERFNPGIGRNIGAKLATGKLLLFVDSDVVLESSALENAWNYYQEGNKIFGGASELNLDANPNIASYLEHFFFNSESQRGRPACTRSSLSSALMFIEREIFLSEHGFKNIPRMQDTELTERLVKKGCTLMFNPKVIGFQIQDSALGKVLRKILINGKNLYFIRYKEQEMTKKLFLFLLLPLLSTLKILRIIGRHLLYQNNKNRLITLLLSPLLLFSSWVWMVGMYNSMIFGGDISTKRD